MRCLCHVLVNKVVGYFLNTIFRRKPKLQSETITSAAEGEEMT